MGSQEFRAIYFRCQPHSRPFWRIPQVKNYFWVPSVEADIKEVALHRLGEETGSHHFRLFGGTNKSGPLSADSIAAMAEEAGSRAALLYILKFEVEQFWIHTGCKQNPHCSFTYPTNLSGPTGLYLLLSKSQPLQQKN